MEAVVADASGGAKDVATMKPERDTSKLMLLVDDATVNRHGLVLSGVMVNESPLPLTAVLLEKSILSAPKFGLPSERKLVAPTLAVA